MVNCQECWGAGISPPELAPLPADILDRWKITEMVKNAPRPTQPQPPNNTGTGTQTVNLATGNWACVVAQQNGANLQGAAQVAMQGNNVQIVSVLSYQVAGADGRAHQAHERNAFVGTITGRQLIAQCRQAVWTLDGQPVQPQGLPYTLSLVVAANGRTAQGNVTNVTGNSVQITMQAQ